MAKAALRWADREFAGLDLGDGRLNKRAKILMERFAASPEASIPAACDGWSETLAAYRFLRNTDVDRRDSLAPHWARTQECMQAHPVMLCIQGTTELDFNGQETTGLGRLNEARRGKYMRLTYAVTPGREPLGVLDAWMWARSVDIADGKRGRINATCIVAREVGAPEGIKPLEWPLLTNRPATTSAQVVELIDWYRARWESEICFHVLKNGCEVETLQLGAIDRVERALALYMVVAWRITYLMCLGRNCPDLDATLFFSADEIRRTYLLAKQPRPAQPPGLNEVIRLIAKIGGFLGRKSDGEPGVKTIWRGLDQVMTAAQTLQALRKEVA